MKEIILKNKNGKTEKGFFRDLKIDDIDNILLLQEEIFNGLSDKELYADSGKESFIKCIKETGRIIGCFNSNEELIAMGVYEAFGFEDENYGYDLNIRGDELLKVCQIESTVVKLQYRGNGLQNIICDMLEEQGRKENMKIVGATVSPKNPYSLNTFLKRGFTIEDEKIKYGGYNRYILKMVL